MFIWYLYIYISICLCIYLVHLARVFLPYWPWKNMVPGVEGGGQWREAPCWWQQSSEQTTSAQWEEVEKSLNSHRFFDVPMDFPMDYPMDFPQTWGRTPWVSPDFAKANPLKLLFFQLSSCHCEAQSELCGRTFFLPRITPKVRLDSQT